MPKQYLTLLIFSLLALGYQSSTTATESIELSQPPASLAKWYKPTNKRQVWLHTMFRLRRAVQAVEDYGNEGNYSAMQKWAKKLAKDYRSIPDMIPEWQDDVDTDWVDRLVQAAQEENLQQARLALRKLKLTCKSCHREYRAIVAAQYRSPDYSDINLLDSKTNQKIKFKQSMENLSHTVNRIMIALQDDQIKVARDSSQTLNRQLQDLGASCKTCHKDPQSKTRILGKTTSQDIEKLWKSLKGKDNRASQSSLGHLSVNICARCHSIHRTLAGLRKVIMPDEKND